MVYKRPSSEPVAVVGSSCRFAGGATSLAKLWEVLCEVPDLSQEVPPGRFNAAAFYHPDGEYHGTTNSIKAYWLQQDHRVFDTSMFNITPKEAEAMDPQQRMVLEVVYEAMESAGYTLDVYYGKNVSVFSGVMTGDHDVLSQRDELSTSQYYATGNARSIISNRISYFFNFQGPSMTIDTACSSSLVALHQAMLSLRSGESTMACVTGVNLMLTPEQFLVESSLHMLSPTGKSRMWDASADGYARGEGVAAILLKPLSQALADGDQIMAIIRDTGVNSDGRTKGITLPNPDAQSSLIKETYKKAGLDSINPEDQCQYFEAHGTGTPAGDPREAEAICNAFFDPSTRAASSANTNEIMVGSCKTVLGHTEGAAGLAGLLKVIQAMRHGSVPPNLHFTSINPNVKPFYTGLKIPTSLVPWPQPPAGQPKRASINSFGFGGANAHVIVESYEPHIHDSIYQQRQKKEKEESFQHQCVDDKTSLYLPLLLSASSQVSLRAVVSSYREYLLQHPHVGHDQLAWAVFSRRTALPYRLAVSASSRSQTLEAFEKILGESSSSSNVGSRNKAVNGRPKILGIFTGQGAQWATMSSSLFRNNEIYRNTIRGLDQVLRSSSQPPDWTLEGQILAEGGASLVNIAAVSQPLCTAVQIGLVDLLKSLNICFHTVIGHSSGEIAAAYVAGRISARDAILISYYRGHLARLASSPEGRKGGMLATGISEKEAFKFCEAPIFDGRLHVAASNSPSSVTLSGDLDTIQKAHEELTKERKFSRILVVDSAYHSPHMIKPAAEYIKALQASDIRLNSQGNETVWVSSVHGRTMNEDEELGAEYWRDNMVNMVRFHDAVVNAISQHGPFDCALEVGPHPALKGPFTQTAKSLGHELQYSSPLDRTKDDTLAFSDFLGFLWSHYGPKEINLDRYIEQALSPIDLNSRIADLPTYPWDHSQLHYRESRISRQFHFKTAPPHELLGVRTRDDNEHEMRWRNLLKADKLSWVEHHSFQGHALLPASAYCIMALDAARCLIKTESVSLVELRDMQIVSGINIERDFMGTEVLFTLAVLPQSEGYDKNASIEADFTLASCPADGTTAMRKNMTGRLQIYLGEPTLDALPPRSGSEAETFPTTPEAFYKMMEETGLTYTGPFRALDSIRRRYNYCSATLKRWHPEDSTTLQISPATLDSCFQSAFLTYAFPGDKSLWTSFLPIRIDRIRFNFAARKGDNLTVDTHMVDIQPTTIDSKTTFFIDMDISNEDGDMEIQVEGLAVAALAHTLPKNDYELYLNTVFDIDPTDEIVLGDFSSDTTIDPALIEDCARVATFFVRSNPDPEGLSPDLSLYYEKLASWYPGVLGTVGDDSWRFDTEEIIDSLIQRPDCYDRLSLIRELGSYQPDFVASVLRTLIEETHHLSFTSRHAGRIAKQIAHRHPQMDILGLAGSESELLTEVLCAIGSAFSSFTVGTGTLRYPNQEISAEEGSRKIIIPAPLDLAKDLKDQLGHANLYDLVLLSASELEDIYSSKTLKCLREIMRLGGFLIVVQSLRSPTKSRLLRHPKDQYDETRAPTPPQWPDVLDTYGFIQVAKNCDQSYFAGYSVMVRQLNSPELMLLKQPSLNVDNLITDHLLIIGGKDAPNNGLVHQLNQRLSNLCRKFTVRATFDEVDSRALNTCTAAIVLADLDQPLMTNMTQRRLDQLRDLLRPSMKILWLTFRALTGNPDNAATFGFTRTVSAEVPSLVLRMLDLEEIESSGDLVADHFICLMGTRKSESNTLWTDEREIHIKDGRRLIPRILPLQQSNDSVNSFRRVVSNQINSLRKPVEVIPYLNSDRLIRYEARSAISSSWGNSTDQVQIYVDYSSVKELGLEIEGYKGTDESYPAYICFGINCSTGEGVMAISTNIASCLSLPREQVYPISSGSNIGLPLISLTMRYIVAEIIASQAAGQPIILIDSDPVLIECVVECVFGERESYVVPYSTIPIGEGTRDASKLLHIRASTRDIKAIFPPGGAVIFDFQPEKHVRLSRQIRDLLPANCKHYSRSSLFSVGDTRNVQGYRGKTSWKRAVSKALKSDLASSRTHVEFDTSSLPNLLLDTEPSSSPFRLIDWRADRNVTCTTKHQTEKKLFRSDRTYLLVGTTKDFGQSLCYLLVEHGARNIVLASRNPKMDPRWIGELSNAYGANIGIRKCDVTDIASVESLKKGLHESMPSVAGIVNGAMVLDDRVFAQMDLDTWERVLRPKTVGSQNLDTAFRDSNLEFFIMTSSFAAIGGHPGQANYAAANMYMNGLAGVRRSRGQAASVLNIGVIYGLGFLLREKEELYAGLEREGYPPISERDIHHMFLEAVAAGHPGGESKPGPPIDITTGLRRFDPADQNPLHWHQDPRFSHYSRQDSEDSSTVTEGTRRNLKDNIEALMEPTAIAQLILEEFTERLHTLLQLPKEAIHAVQTLSELGVDSLAAVEVRAWVFKTIGKDVSVIKLLGSISIQKLCADLAEEIISDRENLCKNDSTQ
ncbi:beta-ketoacyl synthase domain-containing protein [Annulohypoxylon maeteangense]|uniref:beta-ketoacyl synthase domain-containing protein n=1 Tax=Annulohypoxylon maeteangense TaxID=1927788 RepID=UPI002007AF88|nr:beta-ketoacyl synthase domain-containing protein [Annulohypoxylon maeteangense]KAI0880191.1 beta-ketoacyl synthase domain-containing protein [Annulohypoxylon maeteangense]